MSFFPSVAFLPVRPRLVSVLVASALAVTALSGPAGATSASPPDAVAAQQQFASQAFNPNPEKLQSSLQNREREIAALRARAKSGAAISAPKIDPIVTQMMAALSSPSAEKKRAARVLVKVYADSSEALTSIKANTAFGKVENAFRFEDAAVMSVDANELAALASAPGVMRVKLLMPEASGHASGAKLSAGDRALKADSVRARLGVSGADTSVCVISDGVTNRAASQATGDLPADVEVCASNPGEGDEGTAMLEIVHDLAPGAKLAFCSAFNDGLFDAIAWSATQANNGKGCDVIVDDFFSLVQPRFQVSREADLINRVTSQLKKTYVTIAGNLAESNYRKYFVDTDYSGQSNLAGFHDFGRAAGKASTVGFPVVVAPGGRSAVFLQWSEPQGRSRSDFEMFPLLADGSILTAEGSPFSVDLVTDLPQNGSQDPIEAVVVTNTTDKFQQYFMLVRRKSGGFSPIELSMVNNGQLGSFYLDDLRSFDTGILGHNGAAGAITVAAVDAQDPGLQNIRPYSSRGPVLTQFDVNGNRRFEYLPKPDVTGTDGVDVTGAGGFPKNFTGTSAAAPHVGAIAALLRGRYPNSNLKSILNYSAADRGTRGFDNTWGFGVVDAERAFAQAPYLGNFPSFKSAPSGVSAEGFANSVREDAKQQMRRELEGASTVAQ
jgi:subtilisin family serine protease